MGNTLHEHVAIAFGWSCVLGHASSTRRSCHMRAIPQCMDYLTNDPVTKGIQCWGQGRAGSAPLPRRAGALSLLGPLVIVLGVAIRVQKEVIWVKGGPGQ